MKRLRFMVFVLIAACHHHSAHPPGGADGGANPDGGPTGSPMPQACMPAECGLSCDNPAVCGACGNGVCDPGESSDTCPSDCCDAAKCDPSQGTPVSSGSCAGAADGTPCDDGDPANGAETCHGGKCLREPANCRCLPAGGAFPSYHAPESSPPPDPGDPAWVGTPPTEPAFAALWGLARIDTSRAWQISKGSPSLKVAIIDTGCDAAQPDFLEAVQTQIDVSDNSPQAPDTFGHGTMMASLVAARADGKGIVGVAPKVTLLCARVAHDNTATPDDIAAGLTWAVAQGAKIALIGFAGLAPSSSLKSAIDAAAAADVLVVAPAGSTGGGNLDGFPAAYDSVLSVAASTRANLPASGSELSPRTWLLAPGEGIIGDGPGGSPLTEEGSSVAAALAAGAAALVRSAAPSLTAPQVRALLHATARPVPLGEFERLFRARRLDVGRAVAAASPGRADAAVAGVRFVATTALPGAPALARVLVENRGLADAASLPIKVTTDAGGTVALASAGPGIAGSGGGAMIDVAMGQQVELTFAVTPPAGAAQVTLHVEVALGGDADASNDAGDASVSIAPLVSHRLRVENAEIVPPAPGDTSLTAAVTIENAGNVAEAASELRLVLYPPGTTPLVVAVPPLAAGERAALKLPFTAAGSDSGMYYIGLFQRPAPGQSDITSSSAFINFTLAPDAPYPTAYFQLHGENFISDTPWRTIRDEIPLLLFFARTSWVDVVRLKGIIPTRYTAVHAIIVRNPVGPKSGTGNIVYENHSTDGVPKVSIAGTHVSDEDGMDHMSELRILFGDELVSGAHRLLWLPVAQLQKTPAGAFPDPASGGVFLDSSFRYEVSPLGQLFFDQTQRKMMGVEIGSAIPTFTDGGHYFDAHFHSIAEWYNGPAATGPAKAYGGPLEMLLSTAWSLGFVDQKSWSPTVMNQIITTDHNTFFDDDKAPGAGPTQNGKWGSAPTGTGSPEFDIMRKLVGRTAAEEVTLNPTHPILHPGSLLGPHALVYEAQHVNGAWGYLKVGGCLPSFRNVLTRLSGGADQMGAIGECGADSPLAAAAQSVQKIGGFMFAAHPYAFMFNWEDEDVRASLELDGNNDRSFVDANGEFAFRGYQFWNLRPAQTLALDLKSMGMLKNTDPRDNNPYAGSTNDGILPFSPWSLSCGDPDTGADGYRNKVWVDLAHFLGQARDGLVFNFADNPATRFFRKMFFVAGSDAHGDFDYTMDWLSEVVGFVGTAFSQNTLADSAYGRPRTYVLPAGDNQTDDAGWLHGMQHGRAVVTDGPLVDLQVDGEGRADFDVTTGKVTWHDGSSSFHDADGQLGGSGKRDGGRSVLVPFIDPNDSWEAETQEAVLQTRCTNVADFGGTSPTAFELVETPDGNIDPKGKNDLPILDLSNFARCDGNWQWQGVQFGQRLGVNEIPPINASIAVLAHAQFGSQCPGIYDAFTNPLWVAPVVTQIPLIAKKTQAGYDLELTSSAPGPQDPRAPAQVTVSFPVSMMSGQPLTVRVKQIDPGTGGLVDLTGGTDGQGGLQVDPLNGWQAGGLSVGLTLPSNQPIHVAAKASGMAAERYVLVVERQPAGAATSSDDYRLQDSFGNPLGMLAVRFRSSVCNLKDVATGPGLCGHADDGTIWRWGGNPNGQLGLPPITGGDDPPMPPEPARAVLAPDSVEVAGSNYVTCARKADGTVSCWGAAGYRGDGGSGDDEKPHDVGLTGVLQLSAGPTRVCARTAGAVYCWGDGLARGGTTDSTPTAISGITAVDEISAGGTYHACARKGGAVYCWGDNSFGALGTGNTNSSAAAVPVTGLPAASQISTGFDTSCAVAGGNVWCWGYNYWGQVGDATTGLGNSSDMAKTTPQKVIKIYTGNPATTTYLSGVTEVRVSQDSTCARIADALWCWGGNAIGIPVTQADPSFHYWPIAGQVVASDTNTQQMFSGAKSLFVNYNVPCALKTDGSLWCLGRGTGTIDAPHLQLCN